MDPKLEEQLVIVITKLDAVIKNQEKQNGTLESHEIKINQLEKEDIRTAIKLKTCERAVVTPMRVIKVWGSILTFILILFEVISYIRE